MLVTFLWFNISDSNLSHFLILFEAGNALRFTVQVFIMFYG